MRRRHLMGLGVLLLAFSLLGCDRGKDTTVSGKVTFRGKPLNGGRVSFVPENGGAASGVIGHDGTYKLDIFEQCDKIALGTYRVAIRPGPPAKNGMARLKRAEISTDTVPALPEKYSDDQGSGLNAEVKSGSNVINFDLD